MRWTTRLLFLSCYLASLGQTRAEDRPMLPANVTFSEHIAPLVFNNCTSCHRAGQVAPFSLLNYNDTRKHAKTMLRVMQDRYMPPWQPEPGHGEFRNERRLTPDMIRLFEKWVETGMNEGDATKTPALPKFPEGWQLGTPDLIVRMDRPFTVPASGPDIYQNFVIPLNIPEDKWVTGVEFRATAPTVLHHMLYFVDDSGRGREAEAKNKTGQPGFPGMGFRPTGTLGGWAVGATPVKLPDGLAYPLKKNSDLVLQTHFHLSGKVESETITVGIYFADKPPARTLVGLQLPPTFGLFANIDIPAGQKDFQVQDSFILPYDVDLIGAGSHAHYIAKTLQTTATLPSGEKKSLFYIRDWDFNWQGQYLYKEPVRLPKGTVIRGEIHWDNSSTNPRNPSQPPVRVRWGEGSTDEMGSVSLMMLAADEANAQKLREAIRFHTGQMALKAKLRGDKLELERFGLKSEDIWKQLLPKGKNAEPKKPNPMSMRDIQGQTHDPLTLGADKAHVLFFVTTDCPIANSYAPEMASLVNRYGDRAVRFYAVHVDAELTLDAARKHSEEFGLKFPVLIDREHRLVAEVGATHTPEVAVIAADGQIAYRGRIDDRYPSLGKKLNHPTEHDLRDALDAILVGKPVVHPRTVTVGCLIPDVPKPR